MTRTLQTTMTLQTTSTLHTKPTANPTGSSIVMYTPAQTCVALAVSETALIDMVNTGRLSAYNLGGNIRFKVNDVQATVIQRMSSKVCPSGSGRC